MGAQAGIDAWTLGTQYFDGSVLDQPLDLRAILDAQDITLDWEQRRGLFYQIESGPSLQSLTPIEPLPSHQRPGYADRTTRHPRSLFRVSEQQ